MMVTYMKYDGLDGEMFHCGHVTHVQEDTLDIYHPADPWIVEEKEERKSN